MRKLIHTHDKLKIMMKEELNKFINEIYDSPLETEYEMISTHDYNGNMFDIYRFKTNSGNSYDVDFLHEIIDAKNILLNNNELLSTIIKDNIDTRLNYIDLGFTPTEIKDIEVDDSIIGTIDDPYIKKTKRNEQYELLNRVSYLILEYIKNNPEILIYSIGKNTHENNLTQYVYIFNKLFSSNFDMFDVKNPDYKYGSYFYINKNILK